MNKINAIVIDDESLNRDLITKLILKTNNNFNIIACAEDISLAYNLINEYRPDVIFLDIKMPMGSGFDLLKRFDNPEFEVVFVTGFDKYAIKAFDFNALDYILKPIDVSKLRVTLEKVQKRIFDKLYLPNNLKEILSSCDEAGFIITKIPIHDKDKVLLIDLKDVISIEADFGYTKFIMIDSKYYVSAKQLSSFEFIIDSHNNFIKINKGLYINANFIKNYSKGVICIINMINNSSYEVSRRKKGEILSLLQ